MKKLHWPLEDPAAAQGTEAEILARFREIRDQTEVRVLELLRGEAAGDGICHPA